MWERLREPTTVTGRLSEIPGLPLKRPWGTRDGSADGVVGCEEVRDISLGPAWNSRSVNECPSPRAPSRRTRARRNRRAGRYLLNAAHPAGFAADNHFTTVVRRRFARKRPRARRIFPGGARKSGILTGFAVRRNKMCAFRNGFRFRNQAQARTGRTTRTIGISRFALTA